MHTLSLFRVLSGPIIIIITIVIYYYLIAPRRPPGQDMLALGFVAERRRYKKTNIGKIMLKNREIDPKIC